VLQKLPFPPPDPEVPKNLITALHYLSLHGTPLLQLCYFSFTFIFIVFNFFYYFIILCYLYFLCYFLFYSIILFLSIVEEIRDAIGQPQLKILLEYAGKRANPGYLDKVLLVLSNLCLSSTFPLLSTSLLFIFILFYFYFYFYCYFFIFFALLLLFLTKTK
jgi:hypothetical protein